MKTIALLGNGTLHRAVQTALEHSGHYRLLAAESLEQADCADLIVATLDVPDLPRLLEWNRQIYASGRAFLQVWAEFGEVRVGPLVTACAGCLECAETRRINNEPKAMFHKAALTQAATLYGESLSVACGSAAKGKMGQ
ncbi:MAG: hypothetical protein ING75_03710 [Rhodocyclaceae bacterium]|nr:hypothetical protein [Rhodocyclaceae bacterium]